MRDPLENVIYAKPEHIGQLVRTAGPIDLDLEDQGVSFNCGSQRYLPTGFPMVLKHIDDEGMAYAYHHNNGVMKMPALLLVP